jgi:[ribosomal protein S5]-alanine N-acetyltransferase
MEVIFETNRLILRKFTIEDASFILELVNTPLWLQFIGQRNVHSLQDAILYLQNGPLRSYEIYGFGFYAVLLKKSNELIGMCGLIKRDSLENVDLGYAFLPTFSGQGFGFEAAAETLKYAFNIQKINKVLAIVDPQNDVSVKLLKKLGMKYVKMLQLSPTDIELMLFQVTTLFIENDKN